MCEERVAIHDQVSHLQQVSVDAIEQPTKNIEHDTFIPLTGDVSDAYFSSSHIYNEVNVVTNEAPACAGSKPLQ